MKDVSKGEVSKCSGVVFQSHRNFNLEAINSLCVQGRTHNLYFNPFPHFLFILVVNILLQYLGSDHDHVWWVPVWYSHLLLQILWYVESRSRSVVRFLCHLPIFPSLSIKIQTTTTTTSSSSFKSTQSLLSTPFPIPYSHLILPLVTTSGSGKLRRAAFGISSCWHSTSPPSSFQYLCSFHKKPSRSLFFINKSIIYCLWRCDVRSATNALLFCYRQKKKTQSTRPSTSTSIPRNNARLPE